MKDYEKESRFTLKQRKIISIIIFAFCLILFGVIGYYIGKPMIKFVSEPEKFRIWVNSHGIWGRIIFIFMLVIQVLIALIPGEPFEMGAGYAFGAIEGTILCVIGNLIGGLLIFALVRTLGMKFVEIFYSREKIHSLKFLQNSKRFNFLLFIVFLMPGTPKDLLSYFVGLTPVKWSTWIFITTIARLPSILTSTICGGALGDENYKFAIIVLFITLILSVIGLLIYRIIQVFHKKK